MLYTGFVCVYEREINYFQIRGLAEAAHEPGRSEDERLSREEPAGASPFGPRGSCARDLRRLGAKGEASLKI